MAFLSVLTDRIVFIKLEGHSTCLAFSNIKGSSVHISFHFRSCLYIFLFITICILNISAAKIHFFDDKNKKTTHFFDDNKC